MKVIHFVDGHAPNWRSAASRVRGLVPALAQLGVESLVATNCSTVGKALADIEPVMHFDSENEMIASRAVSSLVERARGKLIAHSHTIGASWFSSIPCRRVLTVDSQKFVIDARSGSDPSSRRTLAEHDWVIGTSKEVVEVLKSSGVPSDQLSHIPNGVDTDCFQSDQDARRAFRQENKIADNAIVVVCPKSWSPVCGVIDFAHSLRFLKLHHQELALPVSIVLAGDNNIPGEEEYVCSIRSVLDESELGRAAIVLGEVSFQRMRSVLAAADICVIPSLRDTTSCVALEAMAAELSLVCTSATGLSELVVPDMDGLLVDEGNSMALADALGRLILNRELRQNLGKNARLKVQGEFDWQLIANRVASTYE